MERKKQFQNMLGVHCPGNLSGSQNLPISKGVGSSIFFSWLIYIFTKFRLEKYDFDSYKGGFFMGKMVQICWISNFKNSKLPESYDNFQKVAKNIEGFCCF
jgi:hypothetical protein